MFVSKALSLQRCCLRGLMHGMVCSAKYFVECAARSLFEAHGHINPGAAGWTKKTVFLNILTSLSIFGRRSLSSATFVGREIFRGSPVGPVGRPVRAVSAWRDSGLAIFR